MHNLLKSMEAFHDQHGRQINYSITAILITSSTICYILCFVLFLAPRLYHFDFLVHPNTEDTTELEIKPSPAVFLGLITPVLTSTTSALILQAVEHFLWHKLTTKCKKRITVGESRELADFTSSSIARLRYIILGNSWPLKVAGSLFLGLTIINPVLLSGISPKISSATSTMVQPRTLDLYGGYLDYADSAYFGGGFSDIPGTVAATVAMSNLSAPAASVCDPKYTTCFISAIAASLQASCTAKVAPNPNLIGITEKKVSNQTFCSEINKEVCITLNSGSPTTYAQFTSGYPAGSQNTIPTNGSFTTIFGVYTESQGTCDATNCTLNYVDCVINYGTVTISQNLSSTPSINPNSFVKATTDGSSLTYLHRVYTDSGTTSPFSFTALGGTGDGATSLFKSTLASLLLGFTATDPPAVVAQRIEDSFTMGTLMAFSRSPQSSNITMQLSEDQKPVWVYNPKVLLILILPLILVVSGTWGRWRVGGNEVVGYNPVEIAKMGVIEQQETSRGEEMTNEGECEVWGEREERKRRLVIAGFGSDTMRLL